MVQLYFIDNNILDKGRMENVEEKQNYRRILRNGVHEAHDKIDEKCIKINSLPLT